MLMDTEVYKSLIMTVAKNMLPRRFLVRKKIICREKHETETK